MAQDAKEVKPEEQSKLIDRRMLTILLIVFVQIVGASMALPVLPLYAKSRFNMEPEVITLLISSFFFAQFIAGPYIGRLSDQYGRVPVLIISQIGTAISFLMLAFGQSIMILFAARLFDGITGGNIIVAQAYVTDITPKERRTQALGLIFAAFGMGFIFGPALGGILAAVSPEAPFVVASIAATLTFILTYFTLDETLTPEQRQQNRAVKRGTLGLTAILGNTPLMIILIVSFFSQFGLGLLQSTFALYGEAVLFDGSSKEVTNLGIGLLLSVVGMGQLFTQVVVLPRAVKVFDDAVLVVFGVILRGIAMFILALVVSPWLAVFGSIFFAMGSGLQMPPLQSMSTRAVDETVRGGVLGVYQSSVSLATIVSTAIAGMIFSLGPTLPFWVGGTLFAVLVIPAVMLVNWQRRRALMQGVPAD